MAEIRALLCASRVNASRAGVWNKAADEVLTSSFAATGQEGAADGAISTPLMAMGSELEMVPITEADWAISRAAKVTARVAKRRRKSHHTSRLAPHASGINRWGVGRGSGVWAVFVFCGMFQSESLTTSCCPCRAYNRRSSTHKALVGF